MDKNQIIEQERKVEEMRSIVEKQEKRIQSLRSNTFKLANCYFVFQGVILTAISGRTSLTCSHLWLPFTLSSLAGMVNLVALFTMGLKYTRTLSQQHENQLEYQAVLQNLHHLKTFHGQRQSPVPSKSENPPSVPSNSESRLPSTNSVEQNKDHFTKAKHCVVFVICITLFVAFLCVTMISCWKILCGGDKCENLPDNEKCINLCDGAKCIRVCREY
ncbi:hypothetical protein PVL29_004295 [Vitis rotundifolia]|uniref:Transmembrane protein n=1 Tax=Vitis rotundifolia TaxID=103349 RepID=A0AA39A7T0_VITRO|nr:hypothetical protein PVL29_004295 [Vitis rotundifolia]